MNTINFLPASYERRRRRRARLVVETALVIVVGALLVGVSAALQIVELNKRQHVNELEHQVLAARKAIDEAAALQALTRELQHQLTLQRELVQPINHSQILATMSQLVPASMTMTEWHATLHCPRPEPYRPATQRTGTQNKRAQATPPASTPRSYIALTFSGMAARDGDLADLVGALDRHPIFDNVKLHYSRQIEFLRQPCRDFRMSVQVPLNCRLVPQQEMADAH